MTDRRVRRSEASHRRISRYGMGWAMDTDNADTRSLYSNVLQYDYLFKVSADYSKSLDALS